MDNNERNILQVANEYNEKLSAIQLPEMDVDDLLDLVDYYTRIGMDFEAEMYKRIAATKFPTHPDVLLMCAHWEADEGNWDGSEAINSCLDKSQYEGALFEMEKFLRKMHPEKANDEIKRFESFSFESSYLDFLFDAADLFREFGFMNYAIHLLKQIPTSYPDYKQVIEALAECYYYQADYKNALLMLDQALDKNPFDDYLWAQTALVNYKNNQLDKALDACEYSLAIVSDNPRASQLKHLLTWQQDDNYDVHSKLLSQQDYVSFIETGNKRYLKGDYVKAEEDFETAGYYCPRGNRDRVQIAFKIASCRIMLGQGRSGVETLLSTMNLVVDLWPYALSLTQLLLATDQANCIQSLLAPLIKFHSPSSQILEPIIMMLSQHNCYLPVEALWRYIFEHKQQIPSPYKELVEIAENFLNR